MQCRYCQAWNESDERRCVRCGRRLHLSAPRPAPEIAPISSATAPRLEILPRPEPSFPPPDRPPYQPSLFRDASNGPKVIPIPTLASARPKETAAPPHKRPPRPANRKSRVPDSQQTLEFNHDTRDPRVPVAIYCTAPVASRHHRLLAAAFDASMVLIGIGFFLAIFFICGGALDFSRQNVPVFASVCVLIVLFYRFLWCAGGGDTPGLRFAGLKLVDFDGRKPDREQRGVRQAASLLSVVSAGVGLLWALVDEETLTWHDHISKTFPTPV